MKDQVDESVNTVVKNLKADLLNNLDTLLRARDELNKIRSYLCEPQPEFTTKLLAKKVCVDLETVIDHLLGQPVKE